MQIISIEKAFSIVKSFETERLYTLGITENFSWGEVFTNCKQKDIWKVPIEHFNNALKQAKTMEMVRNLFEKPIIVHSWYRTSDMNIKAGGAKNSYHLKGLATDFHVSGFPGTMNNLAVQKKLDIAPFMDYCGLEFTKGAWTHVDSRGYRSRFKK